MSEWFALADQEPPEHGPPLLVTNNPNARNAFGHMSHVWRVSMVHRCKEFGWVAFDDADRKVLGLTHWSPIEPPVIS